MSAELARLADEIQARFSKAEQYDRKVAEMTIVQRKKADDHRIAAGLLLIGARKLVDSGAAGDVTWTEWCKENIGRSRQDICKVMKIAGFVDPEAALAKERAATPEHVAKHRSRSENVAYKDDVSDISQTDGVEAAETAPMVDLLEQAKVLVESFSIDQREAFKTWFHGYCGGGSL